MKLYFIIPYLIIEKNKSSYGSNVFTIKDYYGKNICYGDAISVEGDGKFDIK